VARDVLAVDGGWKHGAKVLIPRREHGGERDGLLAEPEQAELTLLRQHEVLPREQHPLVVAHLEARLAEADVVEEEHEQVVLLERGGRVEAVVERGVGAVLTALDGKLAHDETQLSELGEEALLRVARREQVGDVALDRQRRPLTRTSSATDAASTA
jgi:hypothetical protein